MRALDIFKDEIGRTMMQMGAPDIRSLGPQFLTWDSDDRRNAADERLAPRVESCVVPVVSLSNHGLAMRRVLRRSSGRG